jgi:hypothetical protein
VIGVLTYHLFCTFWIISVHNYVHSNMTVYWDTAPCSLVEVDRRFRGVYCLHYQGDNTKSCNIGLPLHFPDAGGRTPLWNFGLLQVNHTALYRRRQSYWHSSLWEHEIWNVLRCLIIEPPLMFWKIHEVENVAAKGCFVRDWNERKLSVLNMKETTSKLYRNDCCQIFCLCVAAATSHDIVYECI